jgi:hypothetical protein
MIKIILFLVFTSILFHAIYTSRFRTKPEYYLIWLSLDLLVLESFFVPPFNYIIGITGLIVGIYGIYMKKIRVLTWEKVFSLKEY